MPMLTVTPEASEAILRARQALENPEQLDKNQTLNVVAALYNEVCKVYFWEVSGSRPS
jgi:hypothetical protein